uniref:Uncharacterized protein n=1 Tax=Spongospora subterranea TaxID=70186 RepID=A0A0H5RJT8_9EUKA|eukprot:CRZ08974.1 hypothetical protein [Spongospora subterranea]
MNMFHVFTIMLVLLLSLIVVSHPHLLKDFKLEKADTSHQSDAQHSFDGLRRGQGLYDRNLETDASHGNNAQRSSDVVTHRPRSEDDESQLQTDALHQNNAQRSSGVGIGRKMFEDDESQLEGDPSPPTNAPPGNLVNTLEMTVNTTKDLLVSFIYLIFHECLHQHPVGRTLSPVVSTVILVLHYFSLPAMPRLNRIVVVVIYVKLFLVALEAFFK